MTISAVYASDLSRVRISCTGVSSMVDHATIERSVDQVKWTTVRGGDAVPIVSNACALDDYEFIPNVANYYRATYVDTANVAFIAEGTLSTANNANVTPGLPVGCIDGDVLVLAAAIRNTAGSVNTPAGWALIADQGNFRVFTHVFASGDVAPTVTFSGGVANADTAARIACFRNASFNVLSASQSNASAQNIAFPGVAAAEILPNVMALYAWKQATSTGASAADWFLMSNNTATAGDDETLMGLVRPAEAAVPSGTITVTGGTAAVSKSAVLRLTKKPFLAQETGNVTPSIDRIWVKNLQRPFLNRKITMIDQSERDRPSRAGLFEIINRTDPIAVTELRGSPRFSITLKTETVEEAEDLDLVFSGGDVVYIQVPPNCPRPLQTAYYLIGDLREQRGQSVRSPRRFFTLPLTRCAAPKSVLVGNTVTWQGVVNVFATWADLIAAEPTWADVLERIDTPADVEVP